jgi:hypothetical protein
MDFVEDRKEAFQRVFNVVNIESPVRVPATASLDRFAVIKPKTQHWRKRTGGPARLSSEFNLLGRGANAQENCYIINSKLEGNNVTAHGAKIIDADMGKNVFVGFNSFLRGRPDGRLTIGKESVIMPHTIIDIRKPLTVPPGSLVWGLVTKRRMNSKPTACRLKEFSKDRQPGDARATCFSKAAVAVLSRFQERIHHILEANGAFLRWQLEPRARPTQPEHLLQHHPALSRRATRKGCTRPLSSSHKHSGALSM